jgi:hypothetical protein
LGYHALPAGSDIRSFYVDGHPSDVTVIGPAGGADADSSTLLLWTESHDPDSFDVVAYSLEVDDDSLFASPEARQDSLTDNITDNDTVSVSLIDLSDFPNLMADTTYFWRARAVDAFGLASGWSAPGSFVFFRRIRLPDAEVSVTAIADSLIRGEATTDSFVIANVGGADLAFELLAIEFPPASPAGIPVSGHSRMAEPRTSYSGGGGERILNTWLFVEPAADTLPPGDSAMCMVTLSAANLVEGDYAGEIRIGTNAPADSLMILPVSLSVIAPGCEYVPGDANGSRLANGIDVTYLVAYLKDIGPPPPDVCDCGPWSFIFAAADANGSCTANGIDVTYMVSYLKGGPPLRFCPECPPTGLGMPPDAPNGGIGDKSAQGLESGK